MNKRKPTPSLAMELSGLRSFQGMSAMERFEASYMPEPNSGCWLWIASVRRENKPYGLFSVDGRSVSAHRFSYETFKGPILNDLWVLHKCDNPACVNPEHLFLGDQNDNVADCVAKGRHARGHTQGHARLTPEQVEFIRGSSLTYVALAKILNVDKATVRRANLHVCYK